MQKKLLVILFLGFILLGTTGCGRHGRLHEYDDFIKYVNNLQCGMNSRKVSCNLEGKYELTNIEEGKDDDGKKTRTYTFKIKDSNLSFNVYSQYFCTGSIDGTCFDYTYTLMDSYHVEAFKYYLNDYNKKVGFDDRLQYYFGDEIKEPLIGSFDIKTSDDLIYIINYMKGFLDYANDLNMKFLGKGEDFIINFTENKYGYDNSWVYSLSIYFDIDENDKYIYKFKDDYYPEDGKLDTYIYNYMDKNGITLK